MPATIIPVKGLYLGFVGNISNEGYSLRTPRQLNPTDTLSLSFGETLVLNANNTYSSLKQFLLNGSGLVTAALAIGLAASNVNINSTYTQTGSLNVLTPGGGYLPGQVVDGLVQGTINVSCNNGTPVAGGAVYVRTAINAAIPAGVVGGLEAVADPNPVTTALLTITGSSTAASVNVATGITAGMIVSATGITPGTYIKSIVGTAIVLSQVALSGQAGEASNFTSNVLYPNFQWKTGYLEVDTTAQVTVLARTIA